MSEKTIRHGEPVPGSHGLHLEESDRQLVLLALATLSLRSPGFDDALNRIAVRIDNVKKDRAELYDELRRVGVERAGPGGSSELVAAAWETTMRARAGDVCGAQSKPLTGDRVYAYCTRERKHEGEHVATGTMGYVVARWRAQR